MRNRRRPRDGVLLPLLWGFANWFDLTASTADIVLSPVHTMKLFDKLLQRFLPFL